MREFVKSMRRLFQNKKIEQDTVDRLHKDGKLNDMEHSYISSKEDSIDSVASSSDH